MRGDDQQHLGVFSYVSPEQRIPKDHPLRPLRAMAYEALRDLRARTVKDAGIIDHLWSACSKKCYRTRVAIEPSLDMYNNYDDIFRPIGDRYAIIRR